MNDSNVTFTPLSEAFWARQLPLIDQASLDRLQDKWDRAEVERQKRERQGRL